MIVTSLRLGFGVPKSVEIIIFWRSPQVGVELLKNLLKIAYGVEPLRV